MAMTTEAPAPALTNELTYEAYMAEPQVEGRYDIVNGMRIFMPGATWRHQRIAGNIARALRCSYSAFAQNTDAAAGCAIH